MLKVIVDVKPDIILTFTIKPNLYGSIIAAITNIKIIQNITGLGSLHNQFGIIDTFTKFIYTKIATQANIVFFQNTDDLKYFSNYKPSLYKNYKLLPGSGVDTGKFCPVSGCEIKNKNNSIKFLFFGRLLEEKGIFHFLNVARYFFSIGSKNKFYVLGFLNSSNESSITFNDLEPYINQGIIEYLGSTDDVSLVLPSMDCVIFPSFYSEGVPRSLLESASCGIPIITTNNRGCKEVVVHGLNGFLCEPNNSESLLEQVIKFNQLDDRMRHEMGINSRRIALRKFDEKIVLNKYINALKIV